MSPQENESEVNDINILFRHESGKMIPTFARLFGIERLELAERVVEESFSKAKSFINAEEMRGIPSTVYGISQEFRRQRFSDSRINCMTIASR